jgi:DNA-binding NtrC family response regulator
MKSKISMLIIEDDKYTRLNLRELLNPYGVLDEASDSEEAKEKLKKITYDIVLTDIEIKEDTGLDLIPMIVRKGSHCIVVSSFESDEIIEKAYQLGASHYLSKFDLKKQLPVYIQKFLLHKNARLDKFLEEDFITKDPDSLYALKELLQFNLKNQCLFITGPSGTGKSLLGKLIHEITHPESPLIHLNCSEVSESLLESELFGHEKGAFTGADYKKEGKLKQANGGTLFLDEVATMPLSMQQKLLKALDEKTFYPVGSTTPVKSEFTLISATCEDIKDKIGKRLFREDLYYRLNGFNFYLKPISQRIEDIEPLIKYFQKKASRRFVIRPEALDELKRYSWPGNIRELRKICDQFSQVPGGIIDLNALNKLLPLEFRSQDSNLETWSDQVKEKGLKLLIQEIERRAVEDSMKRNNGKVTACIKELKISSSAFYRILQENKLNF